MNVVTAGRRDIEEYFSQVVLGYGKLTHTPLLAFVPMNDEVVEVRILTNPGDTLDLPDTTPMMGQWTGERRSDFFQFTAGELKTFVAAHPDKVFYKKVWRMA